MVLLVAGVVESIPGAVLTEVGVAGLVPVLLVLRKQVRAHDVFVVEIIKGEARVFAAEG